MADQQPPAGETQRIDYDPEVVIARLQARLAAVIGAPAAEVEVEAARLDAIVRSLAGQNAALQAQIGAAAPAQGGAE
jgi:hypothetical protein